MHHRKREPARRRPVDEEIAQRGEGIIIYNDQLGEIIDDEIPMEEGTSRCFLFL